MQITNPTQYVLFCTEKCEASGTVCVTDFPCFSMSRGLIECPPVVGLEKLRMLNLQHNLLRSVHSLETLRRLVFLDLYDNQISELSGIACLSTLKVLMLGKNRCVYMCVSVRERGELFDSLKEVKSLCMHL